MPVAPASIRNPTFYIRIHDTHPDQRYAGRTLEMSTSFAKSERFAEWMDNGGLWYLVDADTYDPTSSTERMIDFEEISTGKIYIAMPVPSEEYE